MGTRAVPVGGRKTHVTREGLRWRRIRCARGGAPGRFCRYKGHRTASKRMHGGTAALKALSRASAFARATAAGRTTPKSLKNSTVKRPPVNRELIHRPAGRAGGDGRPSSPASPASPPASAAHHILRQRAAAAFERRDRVLADSAAAFRRGDKLAAAELAGEARALFSAAAAHNARAAEHLFRHHNPSLETDVVDLHGLYVPEALFYFSAHLQRCLRRGETRVTCVVGRGKNTAADGGSRLLPAVWVLCQQLDVHAECAGAGVLAVCADQPFDPSLAGPTLHRGW